MKVPKGHNQNLVVEQDGLAMCTVDGNPEEDFSVWRPAELRNAGTNPRGLTASEHAHGVCYSYYR
jgi:hypothetical protein